MKNKAWRWASRYGGLRHCHPGEIWHWERACQEGSFRAEPGCADWGTLGKTPSTQLDVWGVMSGAITKPIAGQDSITQGTRGSERQRKKEKVPSRWKGTAQGLHRNNLWPKKDTTGTLQVTELERTCRIFKNRHDQPVDAFQFTIAEARNKLQPRGGEHGD